MTEREQALERRVEEVEAGARSLDARLAALERREQELVERREERMTAATAADEERAAALAAREAKLEARERELALIRQGLDAERNALLARERELRRRDAQEARQTFAPPLAPLSFSEGLAAFASTRSRRVQPGRRP